MQNMSKGKLYATGCLLAGAIMLVAVQAQAVIIEYEVATGPGTWNYTYTYNVSLESGDSTDLFNTDFGFTIEFDDTIFTEIQDYNYETIGDWNLVTFQPDPGFDVGIFDALSEADSASLANPFTVNVKVLNPLIAPGSQYFSLYDYTNQNIDPITIPGGGYTVLSGQQQPVPEPGTMLLMGTGLAGLIGGRLRKKKK